MTCPVCNQTNRPSAHFCSHCRAPLILQTKYQILQQLGRGGFGAVYQAAQMNLGGALCAIKELTPDANATTQQLQESATQFQFEARVLAELSHPALPRVTDFFLEGNRYYLVMEFVPGETLEDLLTQNGSSLREAQVLGWAQTLCDVLNYLHARQPPIIHRDIKPANIKITPDGQLKLIDFGIAKILAAGTGTAAAARAVSPPFSPWEQYGKGKGTDTRSDIYALGVTMYQLLTNHLPPDAPDRVNETVIPPRRLNPSLAANTDALITKAMAMRPEDRFQNVMEMKRAMGAPTPRPQPRPVIQVEVTTNPVPQSVGGYVPLIINPRTQTHKDILTKAALVLGVLLVVVVGGIILVALQILQQQTLATSTAQAQAAGTRLAQTTATARALATFTQAQAAMTSAAQVQATAAAQITALAQSGATSAAGLRTSTYGPVDGKLQHGVDNKISAWSANVWRRDFVAQSRFYNPYDRAVQAWDYGFGFRQPAINQGFRVWVDSASKWNFEIAIGGSDQGYAQSRRIAGGTISRMDLSPNGSNLLRIEVQERRAVFSINGEFLANLDLSDKIEPGDVWIGTGFVEGQAMKGAVTRFEAFTILPLP